VAEQLLSVEGQPDVIEFVDCQAEGFVSLTSQHVRDRFAEAAFVISAHTPMWINERYPGADPDRFGRPIYHAWERTALQAADGVIVPSRGLRDRLNLETPALVSCLPMTESPASAAMGSQMILLIGSVQPPKGVDVWARSLNRVLLAKPKATAVLIGTDTPTAPDGLSMAAHIQRLIDPRVLDRFRWIGAVSHDHAMRFVDDAAMVVVPSTFESFSYAAAEAVMRGRSVIVSDQVGLREHIPNLLTVPVGDADALAEAQLQILVDADEAHQQALHAREQLLAACRADRLLAERAKFYRSLPRRCSAAIKDHQQEAMDRMAEWLRLIEIEESGENGVQREQLAEPASASLLHSR
jgi:hypothetical protein